MTYRLFIDDLRDPPAGDWIIARSSSHAKDIVIDKGLPFFISFDHDLGGDDTAMVFVHWLIEMCMDNPALNFPRDFTIHSANPVGVKNIDGLMKSYIRHISENN